MKQIRSIIRMISFFVMTLGIYSVWLVGSFIIPNKLIWRQMIFRNWARGFRSISGMKVVVVGKPPRPPFLLVSNHLSYIDIVAFRSVIETVFVAKKEIRNWFVAGKIISDMGTIFVDRNNRRDIPRAGLEIVQKLDDGEGVVVFPEGTSTKGSQVLPFNSSFLEFAAMRNLPVAYASLTYKTGSAEISANVAVSWWDDTAFIVHLWRLFGVKDFEAIIRFGDHAIANDDRKKLAHELHERVSKIFVPLV